LTARGRKTANPPSGTGAIGPRRPIAGLQVLTAPNASPSTLGGTNTYLVGTTSLAVIDPGPEDPEHVARIVGAAQAAGRVALILVTHSHPDHMGAAQRLAAVTGAPVGRWRGGDRPLVDGEILTAGGTRLRAFHTPGHAPDHVVFYWEERETLFSGDLILGEGTTAVAPPDGVMEDYLRSLDRIAQWTLTVIAPGHGPLIMDPRARVAEYAAHRRMRERQILDVLAHGPRTPGEVAAAIYQDLNPRLHPAAEGTVLAHLLKLLADGRVRREGNRYYLTPR
jgi:glyoxylase-like metal-dependent hydrolase (beta-lactamase superfamily II)